MPQDRGGGKARNEGDGGVIRIWIVGGEKSVRAAVAAAAERAGVELASCGEDVAALAPSAVDRVVDLGLPPREWVVADLVEREEERARRVLERASGCTRLVRASVLGASAKGAGRLRCAAGAVEEALLASDVPTVALRVGVLLGDCGLTAVLRRCVERSKLVLVPGIDRARLEPLALTDFADYCVHAATAPDVPEAAYELGCGELLTGGLLVSHLADNLGLSRWCAPMPPVASHLVAALGAHDERPRAAVGLWLDMLSRGALPRGTKAWDDFPVRPIALHQAMADATGMILPVRRRGQGRFEEWRTPQKKGILWSRRSGSR